MALSQRGGATSALEIAGAKRGVQNALARGVLKSSSKTMPGRLTAAQNRFTLLIVTGLNAKDAYRQAFEPPRSSDNQIATSAYRLLKKPEIQEAIALRERWVCQALAVDKTFVLGNLCELATQRDDRKAAVRACELLGRHLEPGFFGDNKPTPKEPSDIKALLADIATVNRELLGIAKARGDRQLEALVQATVIDIAPAPAAITAEPAKISPEESTDG